MARINLREDSPHYVCDVDVLIQDNNIKGVVVVIYNKTLQIQSIKVYGDNH